MAKCRTSNILNQYPIRLALDRVEILIQKQQIYDFLEGNNYPDSPRSQGVMKFATQISPLLNFITKPFFFAV